jgi:hypothetical protein
MARGTPNDQSLELALEILDAGLATIDQVREANAYRNQQRPQFGKLAVAMGKLKMAEVFSILRRQTETSGLFGDVAVEMGLLEEGDLYEVLQKQANLTPTLLDSLVALSILSAEQRAFVLQQRSGRFAGSNAMPQLADCDA